MIPLPFDGPAAVAVPHEPQWRVLMDGVEQPVLDGRIVKSLTTWPAVMVDLKLPASALPGLPSSRVLPFGTTIAVQWRVRPVQAWTTIATGTVVRSQLDRPEGEWNLQAVDNSGIISVDVFDRGTWDPPPGMTVAALANYIVHRTYPGMPVNATGPVTTTPVSDDLKVTGDPWRAVAEAVDSCDSWARFAVDGSALTIGPAPVIGGPVQRLATGEAGTITGYSVIFERAYNRAYVTFSDPANRDSKVYGRWTLNDPDSPLNPSNLGTNVGYFEEREGTPTQAEADLAAQALGRRLLGRGQSSRITHIASPWLEPGDTITVAYTPAISNNELVSSVDIPLGDREQQTTLRNSDYVGPLEI
jgi:hypothetical protein